jgi:hypothetical protein
MQSHAYNIHVDKEKHYTYENLKHVIQGTSLAGELNPLKLPCAAQAACHAHISHQKPTQLALQYHEDMKHEKKMVLNRSRNSNKLSRSPNFSKSRHRSKVASKPGRHAA